MYRVLLVDDEELIREGLKLLIDWDMLELSICYEANNGIDALEIVKRHNPELIIADIKMPEMDGVQLLREIRNNNFNSLYIILSGYDSFNYAKEAIKFGAFNYLLKPVQPEDLQEALKQAVMQIKNDQKKDLLIENYKALVGDKIYSEEAADDSGGETLYGARGITNKTVIEVIKFIKGNIKDDLNLEKLADLVYLNKSYLSVLFKNEIGESISDYIMKLRMEKAKKLIKTGEYKTYEVAEEVGYSDARYFSQVFKKHTGMLPKEYQESSSR